MPLMKPLGQVECADDEFNYRWNSLLIRSQGIFECRSNITRIFYPSAKTFVCLCEFRKIRLEIEFCTGYAARLYPVFLNVLLPAETIVVEKHPSYSSSVLDSGWNLFHRKLECSVSSSTDDVHIRAR